MICHFWIHKWHNHWIRRIFTIGQQKYKEARSHFFSTSIAKRIATGMSQAASLFIEFCNESPLPNMECDIAICIKLALDTKSNGLYWSEWQFLGPKSYETRVALWLCRNTGIFFQTSLKVYYHSSPCTVLYLNNLPVFNVPSLLKSAWGTWIKYNVSLSVHLSPEVVFN